MSKQYFWPLTMIILGMIMALTMFGYLPMYLLWFWPMVMLLVGLSALLLADAPEWNTPPKKKSTKSNTARRR
jgi:hypothetical protein